MPKRALVLSGGGATAAFHLGVVEELFKQGHRWDVFCGTSAGAIQAAYLAQFKELTIDHIYQLQELWCTVEKYKPIQMRFPWVLSGLWSKSVLLSQNIERLIEANIDPELVHASGNKLAINATDLVTGASVVFREHSPELRKGVLASSSIPCIFPPVELNGQLLVDGAARTNTPGNLAVMFRENVDISMCSGKLGSWEPAYSPNVLDVLGRVTAIVMDEAFSNDFTLKDGINVYTPKGPLGGLLDFKRAACEVSLQTGRKTASGTRQPTKLSQD